MMNKTSVPISHQLIVNCKKNEKQKHGKQGNLPVTCKNDIKGTQCIYIFALIPMQCHWFYLCTSKNFSVDSYITLNIWMLKNFM